MSLNDIPARRIDGSERDLSEFRGKVLLVVNIASRCGFTPQYAGLEALYKKYRDRGLVVLGFPCNQFGAQEPGSEAEIGAFCSTNYQVTFPMFARIEVNGPMPIRCTSTEIRRPWRAGHRGDQVEFHQVPGRPRRQVVKRFAPKDEPADLAADIEALL